MKQVLYLSSKYSDYPKIYDTDTILLKLISLSKSKLFYYKALVDEQYNIESFELLTDDDIRKTIFAYTMFSPVAAYKWCRYNCKDDLDSMMNLIKKSSYASCSLIMWNPNYLEQMKEYVTDMNDIRKMLMKYPDLTDYYLSRVTSISTLDTWLYYFPLDEVKVVKHFNENILPIVDTLYKKPDDADYEVWAFNHHMEERAKLAVKQIEKIHKKYLKNVLDNQ